MKKSFKLLTLLALSFGTICMSGCSLLSGGNNDNKQTENNNDNKQTENTENNKENGNKDVEVTKVSLSKSSASIEIGEKLSLTATVSPSNATNKEVTWSSDNTDIATVTDKGVVEGIVPGTATIKAESNNGFVGKCTITVKEISVSSITLDKTTLTMEVDTSVQLTATILPDEATNKTVTWTSSKASVAYVDAGLVTAVGTGTATITAKSSNGKTSKCTITVVDTPIVNNGKFTKENLYIYSGTFRFLGTETVYDIRYTFKTDGTAVIKDQVQRTQENRTYKVEDGMLYIYDGEALDTMFFYYDNILMEASRTPVILIKDGSAVSQQGTGTLGYYAIIEVAVGDTLGVLDGENINCYTVPLRKNGTLNDGERYVSYVTADQISASDFDTSKVGTKIIKITVGSKQYNCLFIVKNQVI